VPIESSIWNFLVNLLVGIIAYTYHPIKPFLDLEAKGLPALLSALFLTLPNSHFPPVSFHQYSAKPR
jgi:hypothetical protein